MTHSIPAALVGALVTGALLAGCSGSDEPATVTGTPTSASNASSLPVTTTSATEEPVPVGTTRTAAGEPSPTAVMMAEAEQEYMLLLSDSVPLLTNDETLALRLGHGACSQTKAGHNDDDIRGWVQDTGPSDPVLSNDQADKVITFARARLCPND